MTTINLRETVVRLASRPGHENVRALVRDLLIHGLRADPAEIQLERPVPEVRGRVDALLGRTVFEFKSDLRRERAEADEQLARYLSQREAATGQRYVGIATDGAAYTAHELRRGKLVQLAEHAVRVEGRATDREPERALIAWLGAAVAVGAELEPEPDAVTRELGSGSIAWFTARADLGEIWARVSAHPDVVLKRQLWERLLERVYGSPVTADDLFLQHTYLTVIAKAMATRVLGVNLSDAESLLSGRPFEQAGITGAVESDFFDWPLTDPAGANLIQRIAAQASRFNLQAVGTDVLKGLYESLVEDEQRHQLGEYYTPDWLAARMVEAAIDHPLDQRVLDPACGSGTFLFHAVQHLTTAAEAAGRPQAETLRLACTRVFGVDIHPVAVQIARVTFILALGSELLQARQGSVAIPVYMGDSLQWNTRGFLAEREVLIEVPEDERLLEFPFEVAGDPAVFDAVIGRMLDLSRENASSEGLEAWLKRTYELGSAAAGTLSQTYETLRRLHEEGRDHIWGFAARNLVRPVWLSQEDQRADVVIGNPPWLPYRFMAPGTKESPGMQERFRQECQRRGLWMGQVAQQQDLSAYYFVRCVELYLKPTGTIAFVMPYAAMSRRQFAGFRSGAYGRRRGRKLEQVLATVQFTGAWAFRDDVQPLFPVPSCVLFGRLGGGDGDILPSTILAASGTLPERDATQVAADKHLVWRELPWPSQRKERLTAGYAAQFRAGAVVFPSVLFRVKLAETGRLGPDPSAPLVESRRTRLEKPPWRDIDSLRRNVEADFVRPLYLGESIAPFRQLEPILAVIPWDPTTSRLLDSAQAQREGYAHLAGWLGEAERLWAEHGSGRRTLLEQLNYHGQLAAQFPVAGLRVVYAASGTVPAAAILRNDGAVVEHSLYWGGFDQLDEARLLVALLNSETLRARVAHLQSLGQWGARHFDKVAFSEAIPEFDASDSVHAALAAASEKAEQVAASVPLTGRQGRPLYFTRARAAIREAVLEHGVGKEIERLVGELLNVTPAS